MVSEHQVTSIHPIHFRQLRLAPHEWYRFFEILVQFPQLTSVHIETENLHQIPASIEACHSLEELTIEGGYLHDLPPEIASLPNLTTLRLENQLFFTVPAVLQQIPYNSIY